MDKIRTILADLHYWQLIAELAVFFFIFPLLFVYKIVDLPLWLILIFLGLSVVLFLYNDNSYNKKLYINWKKGKKYFLQMFLLFLLAAFVMVAAIWLIDSSKVFSFPRNNPEKLILLSFAYPLFSVIPQELFYRSFFFHRYSELFSSKWSLIFVNALFFSFGHIFFKSPIVMFLTFIAGLIFAYRYNQSKSLLLTVIEHTLYGVWLFISGLGVYFFALPVA